MVYDGCCELWARGARFERDFRGNWTFFIRREVLSVEDFIGEILFALLRNTRALEDAFFK